MIDHCLEPSIYSKKILSEFISAAQEMKVENYPIHLKFNTGLNRLGFSLEDIPEISNTIKHQTAIKAIAVLSHLAASEDLNEAEFTKSTIILI